MVLRLWLTSYQQLLKDRPIATNIISGTTVMFLGDWAAQKFEQSDNQSSLSDSDHNRHNNHQQKKKSNHDFSRTTVMCSWAAVGDVPINLALFKLVDGMGHRLAVLRGASLQSSIAKSCAFFFPGVLVRMPLMICYITSVETLLDVDAAGKLSSVDWSVLQRTIGEKMEANLMQIIDTGAKLWIPVNTAAFYLISPRYRPLFLSSVTSFWAMYLSLLQHQRPADSVTRDKAI